MSFSLYVTELKGESPRAAGSLEEEDIYLEYCAYYLNI